MRTESRRIAIQATAEQSAPKRRDPVIDGLKLAAAGGIVMVHVAMQPHASPLSNFAEQVSYSALYFFFMIAGYFHGAVATRGRAWLGKRFVRLAVPYYVWSFVFVAWWTLYHFIRHWPQPWYFPDPIRFLFFAGAAEVLWSLPWLFACALLAELFARTVAGRRALLVFAGAVQLAVWLLVPQSAIPNWAIRQFIQGARWVFIYVAGMEVRAARRVPGSSLVWTAGAVLASIGAGLIAVRTGAQPTRILPELVLFFLNGGVALSLIAGSRAGARWFGAEKLAWGGEYLLGIYVSHGLWLAILIRFVSANRMPVWVWLPAGWAAVFAAAVVLTHLLLKSRWTRLSVT